MKINSVSQANAFFQEMLEAKNGRTQLSAKINNRTAHLVTFLRANGSVLVYKDDIPVMLEAVKKTSKKLDKSALGASLDVPANSLNAIKIAKLVEEGRLTVSQLAGFQYEEEDWKLKQRKAKKADVAKFRNQK
jgi:hypothetical protein